MLGKALERPGGGPVGGSEGLLLRRGQTFESLLKKKPAVQKEGDRNSDLGRARKED